MSQPPHSEEPPEEEESKIEEPPVDQELDTRPLKPLLLRRDAAGHRPPPPADRAPPATVLQESPPSPRRRLSIPPQPASGDTDRVRLVPRVPEPQSWRVIFQVTGPTSSTVGLDVRQSLVVGRDDPEGGHSADLDLTSFQAQEHGVSRQHAVLIPTDDGLFLTDLESINGTWVNGEYLEPGQRHLLIAGDQVELGLLRLIVRSVAPLSRSAARE